MLVCPHLTFWLTKDDSTGQSEKKKKRSIDERWEDAVKSGQGLTSAAQLGSRKQDKVEMHCCKVIHDAPMTLRGYGIEQGPVFQSIVS